MTVYDIFLAPFADYGFMRRALIACVCLGLGSGPIGVFLMLRRSIVKLAFGLSLLGHGTNLLILTAGGVVRGRPPLIRKG